MPILPMHLPADAVPAGASHRVTSPGGYEQWWFELGGSGDVRAVVVLFDGCPLHPNYVRRYRRYRRWPTRARPPVAAEYPAVGAALIENDRIIARFLDHLPAGACEASCDRLDLRIGPHHATREPDGHIRLAFAAAGRTLRGELALRPLLDEPSRFVPLAEHDPFGGTHYRLSARPAFELSGQLSVRSAVGGPERRIDMNGRGCHDHRFGTAPLITPLDRALMRGIPRVDCDTVAAG